MSHHASLMIDEISEEDLLAELEKRRKLRALGLCDYCARDLSEPTCKFPSRHRAFACAECGRILSKGKERRGPIGGVLLCKRCFNRQTK